MSIKIYHGYRCRVADFPKVLERIRDTAFERSAKMIKSQMKDIQQVHVATTNGRKPSLVELQKVVLESARAGSISEFSYVFCVDCSMNVFHLGQFVYMIMYGHPLTDQDLQIRGLQEYGYWTNTDKPYELTACAWAVRRRVWDEVCVQDHDRSRMVHKIIDVKDGIGLHSLIRATWPGRRKDSIELYPRRLYRYYVKGPLQGLYHVSATTEDNARKSAYDRDMRKVASDSMTGKKLRLKRSDMKYVRRKTEVLNFVNATSDAPVLTLFEDLQ